MARFKHYSYAQTKMIPIEFSKQLEPGTFEFALNLIIDQVDLSMFDGRFHNDETGAPAYDPAIMLKIILFAYSCGITSSREIAQACHENVIFCQDRRGTVDCEPGSTMAAIPDTEGQTGGFGRIIDLSRMNPISARRKHVPAGSSSDPTSTADMCR